MAYRSLIWILISVATVVAIVILWMQAVDPLLTQSAAPATAPAVWPPSTHAPPTTSTSGPHPAVLDLARAGLLMALVVLGVLLTISLILTLRSVLLGYPPGKSRKTRYVDAWKLAGKRMGDKPPEDDT
jgi:hypothetical protein